MRFSLATSMSETLKVDIFNGFHSFINFSDQKDFRKSHGRINTQGKCAKNNFNINDEEEEEEREGEVEKKTFLFRYKKKFRKKKLYQA